MLGRRQEAKGIALPLSSEKKQAILARLAYTMMDRRVSDLSRTEVLAVIKPALRRASGNVTPGDFLAEARADGLLIERDRDRFAFAHKTFQEYLAAVHIRKKDYVGKLSGVVNDDWWAEVILFHAGQSDASPVIEACLKTDTIATLALALECAEQSGALDPKLQARLDAVQAAATRADELSPSAPDLRRLAGILLSMHLRHRSSTVTGSQVCVRPSQPRSTCYSSPISRYLNRMPIRRFSKRRRPLPRACAPATRWHSSPGQILLWAVSRLIAFRWPPSSMISPRSSVFPHCHPAACPKPGS